MTKTAWFACLALLAAPMLANADELHFTQHGFSIAALVGESNDASQQAVMMMLPAQDGFASNVNVTVQPYADSLDAYLKVSRGEFTQMGLKVLVEKKLGADSAILEYAGQMQGKELHWYARVMRSKKKGKIILATATAPSAQWGKLSAVLKASVDSLKME